MKNIDFTKITACGECLKHALSFYDINVKSTEALNDDNDAFKLTDKADSRYFLKIYGKNNDYDITPNERVYHTYEQIQLESEILHLLSDSALKTAVPIKNINGDFVTTLTPESNGESVFATITSFIDGLATKHTEAPTVETAYIGAHLPLCFIWNQRCGYYRLP